MPATSTAHPPRLRSKNTTEKEGVSGEFIPLTFAPGAAQIVCLQQPSVISAATQLEAQFSAGFAAMPVKRVTVAQAGHPKR